MIGSCARISAVLLAALLTLLLGAVPALAAGEDDGRSDSYSEKERSDEKADDTEEEDDDGRGSDKQDDSSDTGDESTTPSDAKDECSDSHHSDTGHGANQGGPYDSTCEPEHEPGNGSEDGNATGQPCAGCVGNADDKNPGAGSDGGQMPNGSDHNAGYECDRNQGIGQENPAHTGCADSDDDSDDDDDGSVKSRLKRRVRHARSSCPQDMNPNDNVDECAPGNEVLGTRMSSLPGTEVIPSVMRRPATRAAAERAAQLPLTGGAVAIYLLIALTLLGTGGLLTLAARRRATVTVDADNR